MPQVAVRSEHTLISSMRVSPDRTVYRCVLAEVLSSGWRWPDLRLGIPYGTGSSVAGSGAASTGSRSASDEISRIGRDEAGVSASLAFSQQLRESDGGPVDVE